MSQGFLIIIKHASERASERAKRLGGCLAKAEYTVPYIIWYGMVSFRYATGRYGSYGIIT